VIRPVLHYPDRRLKARAVPVRHVGPEVRALARDLVDTARSYPRTVGIAAPQIGVMWRVVHVDCTGHPRAPDARGPMVLVNPRVVAARGAEVGREGCLSLPDITADVRRATEIRVEALDTDGAPVTVEATGFEARAILHEIDHLDGVLILDRVALLARDVFPRRSGRPGSRRDPLVERAATLARLAHAEQRYGSGPYEAHLAATAAVLREAGVRDPELVAAAWLHDVIEDTPVRREAVAEGFGERVAAIVDAVSLRPWLEADEARAESWARVAATPEAVLVKLADRVANTRMGGPKAGRYRAQQPMLVAALRDADPGPHAEAVGRLWAMLDRALSDLAAAPAPAAAPPPGPGSP
jgi:peptide deformylase